MRAARIVLRKQEKKTMKNRIKNLKLGMMVSFNAGRESVLVAAHGLSYGEGYEVTTREERPDAGSVVSSAPVGYSPVPDTAAA